MATTADYATVKLFEKWSLEVAPTDKDTSLTV